MSTTASSTLLLPFQPSSMTSEQLAAVSYLAGRLRACSLADHRYPTAAQPCMSASAMGAPDREQIRFLGPPGGPLRGRSAGRPGWR